ncbi:3-deoxy-manno-octulosonate cytidylyltransferase (CMP-KDO synthetase) [Cohaesibacter sp. ES.047]|uniref:3-deoxy-manno-octulosonate cytidylyltransferase n=1 Tax=Cohaesibacter sp. ES.047 TaxID=1798205 RepID=UPI000BB7B306|nr:3-deoxy-manno-octulosonate cytidylyltransferase [Cohaesibacter sp. ES.047]SNY92721.1 3-deoxy-manno-octulosonate cytidylyltransferase (CMP-KDO synthetase) [Cohaesibacter sp. ES.047]
MSTAIIIPARYGSSRLPGKPMLGILGLSMLERVWRIANATTGCSRVVISTEDQRVVDHAKTFGAEAVLTPESCRNGTERTFATIEAANIEADAVINFQGDAVLTPPWVLQSMIDEFEKAEGDFDLVTPATKLTAEALEALRESKKVNPASGTTVVFDAKQNALYFSKTILPYFRSQGFASVYRHIGLYGYRVPALKRYVSLPPSPLEQTEGLEQLRALEAGMTVRVVIVDYRGRTHASVDAAEDITIAEEIIRREGELVEGSKA